MATAVVAALAGAGDAGWLCGTGAAEGGGGVAATEELLEGGSNPEPAVVAGDAGVGKSAALSSGSGTAVSCRLWNTPIKLPDVAATGAPCVALRACSTAPIVTMILFPSVFTV